MELVSMTDEQRMMIIGIVLAVFVSFALSALYALG